MRRDTLPQARRFVPAILRVPRAGFKGALVAQRSIPEATRRTQLSALSSGHKIHRSGELSRKASFVQPVCSEPYVLRIAVRGSLATRRLSLADDLNRPVAAHQVDAATLLAIATVVGEVGRHEANARLHVESETLLSRHDVESHESAVA